MKLTDAQRANLTPMAIEDCEAGLYTGVRLVKGVTLLTGYGDPSYFYRGREIDQDTSVPNGYWGRWKSVGQGCSTLAQAKVQIDNLLYRQKALWKGMV